MSIYTFKENVWADQQASETVILSNRFESCPTKVVEVITKAFSGTLDIKGAISPDQTFDNVSYMLMGQGAGRTASNAQLSYTTDTSRYRYLVLEPYSEMSLALTRTAGAVNVYVAGWGASMTPSLKTDQLSGSLTNRSGTITAGATAQTIAAALATRRYFFLQNVSTGDLWVNFGTTAVAAQPSIKLLPEAVLEYDGGFVPTGLVSLIGATTGQAFVAKEA